jgi:enterobactin synthetase component D
MMLKQFEPQSSPASQYQFIGSQQFWTHKTQPIGVFSCEFYLRHYNNGLFKKLNIVLPQEIANSVKKRQAEFLAGRYAARQLAIALELDEATAFSVNIGRHRAPVWPHGITGSITHNSSSARCMMSASQSPIFLGLDMEHMLSDAVTNDIAGQVCKPSELQHIQLQGIAKNIALSLIFSAK